ncbi:MAG TPA: carbohydrate ABC transporter permease [Acetobacteraceae bacterium]|jgi:alpha-1,4-digalacturonate transport system permease protein|nr:carbohydrate ABC transporter permease [Acetobacteraceae bacterium]
MIARMMTARRGRAGWDWTDWASYVYLVAGVVLMFGPVLWLALSSVKTQAGLDVFPPTLLPWEQKQVQVPDRPTPAPVYRVTAGDRAGQELAEIRRIGLQAQLVSPDAPSTVIRVPTADLQKVMQIHASWSNYSDLVRKFNFALYFFNSVFITVVATVLTLLVNSMAAFALSKYRFPGREPVFLVMLATLMIPPTIVLVPNYLIAATLGLTNSLWGVIFPAVATPTGVFMLRQYMLTLPDDLLEAARMDNASEWRIYWRIVLPLSAPALAVLAIFSVMWRWNDFLWPMVVLSRSEVFTLPIALFSFQGDLQTQWQYLLAMTVCTLLPVTLIFIFLQRYITQGIASAGVK